MTLRWHERTPGDHRRRVRTLAVLATVSVATAVLVSLAFSDDPALQTGAAMAGSDVEARVWTDPKYGCEYLVLRNPSTTGTTSQPRMKMSPVGGTVQVCAPAGASPPSDPTAR